MSKTINIRSVSELAKGQGVDSAFKEHVALLKRSKLFDVYKNDSNLHDILHVHTFDLKSRSLIKRYKNHGKKVVVSCHVMPDSLEGSLKIPKFFLNKLVKYMMKFYASADRLVVVNSFYKKELVKLGLPEEKIFYIPNYVSRDFFNPCQNDEKISLRKTIGVKKDSFIVVGAGQVQKRKGIDDFAETAQKSPECQFIWVGGFSFGKITDGYEKYKKLLENPPDNLIFTGIVDRKEVANYFRASDLLFLPSYQELFPMTILEAANCHLPLLLRDIDLYKEILFEKYERGSDSDTFSKMINRMKNELGYYSEFEQKSTELSDYYSEKNVLDIWETFYSDLLNM